MKKHILNGKVEWVGEEVFDDRGVIRIFDNYVRV